MCGGLEHDDDTFNKMSRPDANKRRALDHYGDLERQQRKRWWNFSRLDSRGALRHV